MESLFDTVSHFFEVGGWVMPPLMVLTLLLWYAIGYRFSVLRRGNVRSVRVLLDRYRNGTAPEPHGIVDAAVRDGVALAASAPDHLRRRLDDLFGPVQERITRYATLVRTIVAVAPILGLLGTVVGMIETFDSLGDMALFSQTGGIAGGISQALFTTQMGLAVAIPGLVVERMLARRQRSIERELAQVKDLLCTDARNRNG